MKKELHLLHDPDHSNLKMSQNYLLIITSNNIFGYTNFNNIDEMSIFNHAIVVPCAYPKPYPNRI